MSHPSSRCVDKGVWIRENKCLERGLRDVLPGSYNNIIIVQTSYLHQKHTHLVVCLGTCSCWHCSEPLPLGKWPRTDHSPSLESN